MIAPQDPCSQEFEHLIVASLLSWKSQRDALAVVDEIDTAKFISRQCAVAVDTMRETRFTDFNTICTSLVDHPVFVTRDEAKAFFTDVVKRDTAINLDALRGYVFRVDDVYCRRETIRAADALARDARNMRCDHHQSLGLEILGNAQAATEKPTTKRIGEGIAERLVELEQGVDVDVVPTGIPSLDRGLTGGGFHKGHTVISTGISGDGKSALGLQICLNAAKLGMDSLVLSLEMEHKELQDRLLCAVAKVPSNKLPRLDIKPDARRRLAEASNVIETLPIWVEDSFACTTASIESQARAHQRSRGLDFLMIDYLQLIKPTRERATVQENIQTISRDLKLLAKELNCVIFVVAQMNREGEKSGAGLQHLSGSSTIRQDCSYGVVLTTKDATKAPRDVTIQVQKQRNGRQFDVVTQFYANLYTFRDAAGP